MKELEENSTPSSITGMGAVTLPTATQTGSGDVPANSGDAEEEYKKKKKKMKKLLTFESFTGKDIVTEGRVKQFTSDLKDMIKNIKSGYGWIDPEFVEDTWENSSDSIDFELVKSEIYRQLIKAGLLAKSDDDNEEEAGEYIKSLKQLGIAESVTNEAFSRMSKDVIENELYSASQELSKYYDWLKAGNDSGKGKTLDSIISLLKKCKDSIKRFNKPEEVEGTVYESEVTESISKSTKIHCIATPAPKSMLKDELEELFGDDYRNIVTEVQDDEGYESVLVFNLTKRDIKLIEDNIGDVLIWEYSIKPGKLINESSVTEAKSFKNTEDFEAFLKEIDSMRESDIKKIMGKDYIDTPGFYEDEKDDYEDVIDFMISNMGSKEFEKLESWWENNVQESVVTEAKPAGLSKKETLKVAQKFAAALTKLDGKEYTVSDDYEEDSFDLDFDGEEYAGGSYNINADGSVVNMAVWNKKNVSPTYGNMDDDINTIIKTIKNIKESVVNEAATKSAALVQFAADEKAEGKNAEIHLATFDGSGMEAQSTNKTWDDGVPVTKNFTRGGYKRVAPKGEIYIIESNDWWYFEYKGTWYAVKRKDYGTPPFEY